MGGQTSYTQGPAAAYNPGERRASPTDVVYHGVYQTAGGVEGGRFVKRGTVPNSLAALTGVGDLPNIVGVTIWEPMRPPGSPHWPQFEVPGVVHRGKIWVLNVGGVALDEVPFIVHTGAHLGKIAHTSLSGDALQINGVKVTIPGADGALCQIEVDLPAHPIVIDT